MPAAPGARPPPQPLRTRPRGPLAPGGAARGPRQRGARPCARRNTGGSRGDGIVTFPFRRLPETHRGRANFPPAPGVRRGGRRAHPGIVPRCRRPAARPRPGPPRSAISPAEQRRTHPAAAAAPPGRAARAPRSSSGRSRRARRPATAAGPGAELRASGGWRSRGGRADGSPRLEDRTGLDRAGRAASLPPPPSPRVPPAPRIPAHIQGEPSSAALLSAARGSAAMPARLTFKA